MMTGFAYDGFLALDDLERVRIGAMTLKQCVRRKAIIDRDKAIADRAWALETAFLAECISLLIKATPRARVEDVRAEHGEVR